MNTTVQQLLDAFDALPEADKHQAAVAIFCRVSPISEGDVPELALVEAAEELFRDSDAEEARMASTQRRYSKEEFARRGDEVYATQVRPHLKAEDQGKFAAIDIESGAYEIDEDELKACDRLSARIPDAQIWLVRVGSRSLHRFGGREQWETS